MASLLLGAARPIPPLAPSPVAQVDSRLPACCVARRVRTRLLTDSVASAVRLAA